MSQIYVIPADGLMVPDPAVKGSSDQVRLPPEGKWVEEGPYWDRRKREGDVTFGAPPAQKPEATVPREPTTPATTAPTKNALRAKDGDA